MKEKQNFIYVRKLNAKNVLSIEDTKILRENNLKMITNREGRTFSIGIIGAHAQALIL